MIECGKTNRSAAEIVMRKIFAVAITILIADCYVYVKKNPINIFPSLLRAGCSEFSQGG